MDIFQISLRWSAAGPSLVSNSCCLKIAHLLLYVSNHHYPISSSSESHWQLSRTSVFVSCSLAGRLNFLLFSCLSQPSCPDITYLWIYTYANMQLGIYIYHYFSHWKEETPMVMLKKFINEFIHLKELLIIKQWKIMCVGYEYCDFPLGRGRWKSRRVRIQ